MDRTIKRAAIGLLAVTAATLPYAHPAQAQQTELDSLRTQIQELQGRLEKIEADQLASKDAAKASAPTVSTASKMPIVVSGLLQVQANSDLSSSLHPDPRSDSFRLRRGELRLTAPAITDRISGTIMFDPAKSQSGTPANGVLQEIQLSYLLHKSDSSSHYVDLGQFKVPIGYEGDLVSSSALQTVERALMYQALANDPAGGRGTDIRDTGAQLRGTMGQFDYRLAIFNGLGERQNQLSSSDNKALVGRIVFHPNSIKGLQLGLSGARDNARYAPNLAGTAAPPAALVNQAIARSVYNAFAAYKKDKLTLQAEGLRGEFSDSPNNLTVNRSGYYGSVGYLFTPKVEGVLRYDSFDANTATPNTTTTESTLGVNYYLKGNNAKIQANIVRVSPPKVGGASADRTELRTNFQVAF